MRLAAKGVSCYLTLETMISSVIGRVYVEEKERMAGIKTFSNSMEIVA